MGMDSMAGFALRIEEEVLSSKFPHEWEKLEPLLEVIEMDPQYVSSVTEHVMTKGEVTRETIEDGVGVSSDEESFEEFKDFLEAWLALGNAFKKEFGMTLYLGYKNGDTGSEYDDMEDWFFSLNFSEVYEMSSKMKKAIEKGMDIEMSFFTTYG